MASYAHEHNEGFQAKVPLTTSQFLADDSHMEDSQQGPHKMTLLGKVKNSWLPEILAALISTFAFGALIAILRIFNDSKLPTWSYGITLNVVVAVLTIFISLGMSVPLSNGLGQLKWVRLHNQRKAIYLDSIDTFDAASRGPWGSFLLIALSRQGPLSILGATTILLGLLVGVSTQLIIQYPEKMVSDGSAAAIKTSAGYYNYDSGNSRATASPTLAIMQSYYNGMFSSNATDLISPLGTVCPSGNCTWPVTETFAICSRCTNLTSTLIYTPPKSKGYGGGFWAIPGQPINMKDQPDMGRGTDALYVFANETTRIFDFLNMTMLGAHFVDFANVTSPYAFNCGLSFCKQTIETTTVSGVTAQKITQVKYNDTLTSETKLEALTSYESPVNITFDSTSPHPMGINTNVLLAWSKFLPKSTKLPGIVTFLKEGLTYLGDDIPFLRAVAGAAKKGGYNLYTSGKDPIETGEDIPALFERIASSMTNTLRTEAGSIPVEGKGTVSIRYVNVRWEWLILPGVAIVFTWIFLLGVIILNKRSKATKWKSSPLALLAVGSRVSRAIAGSRDADSLVETAKGIRVKMIRDPNSIEKEYLSCS